MPAAQDDSAVDSFDLSERIVGLNINPITYLATDYLNHFGEVIMMLDLIPDMPDIFEEVRDWEFKTYKQHFDDSGFAHSEVYSLAYDAAPRDYREPFDTTIDTLKEMITDALGQIGGIIEGGDSERLKVLISGLSLELQSLNSLAGAIVNGDHKVNKQDAIDALFDD